MRDLSTDTKGTDGDSSGNKAPFSDHILTTKDGVGRRRSHKAKLEQLIDALVPGGYERLEADYDNTSEVLLKSLTQEASVSVEQAEALLNIVLRSVKRALRSSDWRLGYGKTRNDATIPNVAAAMLVSAIDLLSVPFSNAGIRAYRNKHHAFIEAMADFSNEAAGGVGEYEDFYRDLGRQVAQTVLDHKIISPEPQLAPRSSNVEKIAEAAAVQLVYFVQCGDSGPVKIGVAKDPAARLSTLQTGHFETLHIRAITVGGLAQERIYHDTFRAHHQRGEWFAPHPDILAEIERLATPGGPNND